MKVEIPGAKSWSCLNTMMSKHVSISNLFLYLDHSMLALSCKGLFHTFESVWKLFTSYVFLYYI